MLFNNYIDGFIHLANYYSMRQQLELWNACQGVFEQEPLWRPQFVFGKDEGGNAMISPYALENTNCGAYGWLSDEKGVRYSTVNRDGRSWTAMPEEFLSMVEDLKNENLIPRSFVAENCLINKYQDQPSANGKTKPSRLGLHRDKSENNLEAPVISVSLGLRAIFQIGGLEKSEPVEEVIIVSGDLVILGGGLKGARNAYHAVKCVIPNSAPDFLPETDYRLNITIRQVN